VVVVIQMCTVNKVAVQGGSGVKPRPTLPARLQLGVGGQLWVGLLIWTCMEEFGHLIKDYEITHCKLSNRYMRGLFENKQR
jgi:hypothetical protein